MKRYRWIAFNVLAAISALLCAAFVSLWARSYVKVDAVELVATPHRYFVNTAQGEFALQIQESSSFSTARQGTSDGGIALSQIAAWRRSILWQGSKPSIFGFNSVRLSETTIVIGPLAPLALPFVPFPALWVIRWRKQRRRKIRESAGLCPACGYDLRTTAGRCPECGIVNSSLRPNRG